SSPARSWQTPGAVPSPSPCPHLHSRSGQVQVSNLTARLSGSRPARPRPAPPACSTPPDRLRVGRRGPDGPCPRTSPCKPGRNRPACPAKPALPPQAPPSVISCRVLVAAVDPSRLLPLGLIAAFGNQVHVVVGDVEHVQAARVGRIGVINLAVLVLVEDADPRRF